MILLTEKNSIRNKGVSLSAESDQLAQLDRASWSQLDRISPLRGVVRYFKINDKIPYKAKRIGEETDALYHL